MENDNLTTVDAANVLRGGVVEFSEEINGTWRRSSAPACCLFLHTYSAESCHGGQRQ
jgi:hypothetical protein